MPPILPPGQTIIDTPATKIRKGIKETLEQVAKRCPGSLLHYNMLVNGMKTVIHTNKGETIEADRLGDIFVEDKSVFPPKPIMTPDKMLKKLQRTNPDALRKLKV